MTPTEHCGVSSRTAQLWAKTGSGESWHPLGAHLVDTTFTAQRLWSDWLSPRCRVWLSEPFGHDQERAGAYFAWLAGCHDLGKATPAFQIQVPTLAQVLRESGFKLPAVLAKRSEAPHALASAALIGPLLSEEYGWPPATTKSVASILGGHHGWFPSYGFDAQPRRRPELYGFFLNQDDSWITARRELLDLVAHMSGVNDWLSEIAGCRQDRSRELALSGYVVLADWISSNETLFPYVSAPFTCDYVETSRRHAAEALGTIGWQRWSPHATSRSADWFDHRFGFVPNNVQRAAIAAASAPGSQGLMLIEAPMGMGKTEAALAVVETLATTKGFGGLFIGLPTQATSNQLFARTNRWLERLGPGTFVVELAHGAAQRVEAFRALHGAPSCVDFDGDRETVVTAEEWFDGPKRRLLAPFVVGTVDQVLMSSARVRHVALRQVGLLDKVVVIDEVHAYDAHMSVFLRRALRWLGAAGVPVVLLSATLPPQARRRLACAYVGHPVNIDDVGYPSVTNVSMTGIVTSQTVTGESAPSSVRLEFLDEVSTDPCGDEFVAMVSSLAREGANVLVIRNTVDRAQRSYAALADALGSTSVTLIHARFMSSDRLHKEEQLAARFGPAGSRPVGHVVVGTQVLEQSLDVDFDVLVTDLAPIDLVLQRVGRVWRHPGTPRPRGLEGPRLVVAGMMRVAGSPPEFPRGSSYIYGDHLLLRSAALLDGRFELVVPKDIPELIMAAYGHDEVVPSSWRDRADGAAHDWAQRESAHEARAEQFAIPEPDDLPSLLELCRFGIDAHDDDPAVRAAVRDAEASVEVVLARPGTDANVTCSGQVVPLRTRPTFSQVEAALSCTVRLPPWMTSAALAIGVPEGWREDPWLRRLRVVELSADGEAAVGRFLLRYSAERGLEVMSDGD